MNPSLGYELSIYSAMPPVVWALLVSAITGGIAKNIGVVKRIEDELKIKGPESSIDPQLAGAIGAALFARALIEKQRKST